jgi:hypothetical protein
MTIKFIHGSVEGAIIAYQSRVSSALGLLPDARARVMDCVQRGVPYPELEILLCVTLARYDLLPLRIKLMRLAATYDKRAIRYLEWIEDVLKAANRLAEQTGPVLMIDDQTGASREVFAALSVVDGHFRKDRPARGRSLRGRLGLPGQRLRATKKDARRSGVSARAEKKTAERAAYGYFAAEMAARFHQHAHGPNDPLISEILWCVLISATPTEVQHARVAYLERASLS